MRSITNMSAQFASRAGACAPLARCPRAAIGPAAPARGQLQRRQPALQQRRATEVRAEQSTEQKGDLDKRAGRSTYRPSSYTELVEDAVEAVAAAMKDGHNRLEVEFPAVSNVDGGRRRRSARLPFAGPHAFTMR